MIVVDKINRSGDLVNKLCREGNVVNKAYRGGELIYQRTFDSDYFTKEYLTFEILSNGSITWRIKNEDPDSERYRKTIYYRKNGGGWVSITSDFYTIAPTISVVEGDIIEFKGDNADYGGYEQVYSYFSTNVSFNIRGNIMSLINSTNFKDLRTLNSEYTFRGLFSTCVNLKDASNLLLPATTLSKGCYEGMFSNCYVLTAAPELPATSLTQNCYAYMFATCLNLNYIKCLATDISTPYCTLSWTSNVSPTGIFVKAASMNDWETGASGIPEGWAIINA